MRGKMQLVCKIPDELYKKWEQSKFTLDEAYQFVDCVMNGIPLPEHHGRLIDVNELLDDIGLEDNDENRDCNNGEIITLENIDRISTIIPATKEGDGE